MSARKYRVRDGKKRWTIIVTHDDSDHAFLIDGVFSDHAFEVMKTPHHGSSASISVEHFVPKALLLAYAAQRDIEEPPQWAAKMVSLIAGPRAEDGMLIHLDERYENACARFGVKFARRQYWTDAITSVPALLMRRLGRMIGLAVIGELIRHKLGL
ncbi:MAG TPA: hypothetical protein VEI03_15395 [Stellaceae bacterium]|nr:hypothetical protein [Stellaceae bacterium]